VRAAFFLLLFVNLAFLAWAEWIDAPQPVPVNAEYAKLPRLQLVDEGPHGRRPSSGAPAPRKTATEDAPPSAAPTLVAAVTAQCLSVGPFEDSAAATRGASVLQGRGLTPRQRSTEGQVSKGYWVFIGGLKSERDVQQVLRTLEQSHVDDAREMPDTGDLHQVSVGLFSDLDRADRRAQSVQKLGLQPEVAERKVPGTVFWMDVDVAAGAAAPNPQDLASGGEAGPATAGAPIRVVPCPTSAPSTTPSAQPVPSAPELSPTFRTKVATGTPKMP
jgi:cell division septation protein DedD